MSMIPSRRIAFAAAAVILGLTACGEASTNSSKVTAVTPTTTPLAVIRLASGAGGGAATQAADSFAPGEKMSMMALLNFVFSGAMPALPSSGAAWSFPANPEVDEARIAELAGLLGITGEVRTLPADQGGGWMVGSADYTDASLTVSTDGMASWWFNPSPSVYPSTGIACPAYDPAVTGETDATIPVCPDPEPPAGVPSADEAKANATTLFTSMGYDMADYELDVYADEWSANVTAYLMIDGLRTPISLSAGYGAEGALTWASGNLAEPVAAGEYPLVGPEAGLQRLIDQQGMYGYGGPFMEGDMARSASTPVAVGETEGGTAGAPSIDPALPTEIAPPETLVTGDVPAETIPTDTVLIDPMPIDTMPIDIVEPEPIEITLTDVRLDLTMQWDVDGTVWLLPAYAFSDADGGVYTVVAVTDEYIQQPEVIDPGIEPMPLPLPADTVVGAPEPAPIEPGQTEPVAPVEIDLAAASAALAGLSEAEATKVAEANGWTLRVVERDGESGPVTADFLMNRVNVAVTAGIVTAAMSIG
jgi:hypothetical protein